MTDIDESTVTAAAPSPTAASSISASTNPPPLTPSTIVVNGKAVRYVATGSGPPVVLLHGIGRSLDDWSEAHARLAGGGDLPERFTVVAIDMAGFGGSDPVADPDLAALARHVLATLDQLGVMAPAHLIGNSLGGAVAMQIAVDAPDRAASLTLVNSAGFGRKVTIALRAVGIPGLGRLLLSRPSPKRARLIVRSLFFDQSFVTDERVHSSYALSTRDGAADTFARVARKLGTWRGVRPGWRRELLAALSAQAGPPAPAGPSAQAWTSAHPIPMLIMWGTHDLVLPATQIVAAARAFPHARTHLFAQTGHMPQIERAEAFTELVTQFLTEQQSTPTQQQTTGRGA